MVLIDLTVPVLQELNPPPEFWGRLPLPSVPIPQLLAIDVPSLQTDRDLPTSVNRSAAMCTTVEDVKYTMNDVFTAPMPCFDWRNEVERLVRLRLTRLTIRSSANQDTAVRHPTVPDLVFPIWILGAWDQLLRVCNEWAKWKKTTKWLQRHSRFALAAEATALIEATPWGRTIQALTIHPDRPVMASELTRFASNEWLGDGSFLAITKLLNERRESGCWVADTGLSTAIREVQMNQGAQDFAMDKQLKKIAESARDGGYTRLLLPSHVNKNHWILFEVDLDKLTLSWGR